jgi:mono/diheme cytochrome c family protein/Na+-transporting methylmalonyl-CoA/oxaloacetate decarboxylase gamma subunit
VLLLKKVIINTPNLSMASKHSIKRTLKIFVFLFSLLLTYGIQTAQAQSSAVSTDAEAIKAGESLFNGNCKACHSIESRLVGPALKDVYDRRDLPWIYAFVKNPAKVIDSGDEYAVNLFKEYSNIMMTGFPTFSDEEIGSIMAYIKDQTDNPVVAEVAPTKMEAAPAASPAPYNNAIIIGGIIILLILLVVVVLIISKLRKVLSNSELSSEEVEYIQKPDGIFAVLRNKALIGIVAAVVTAVVTKGAIDALFDVGVQQGYAPTQPIKYSHKVHAGDYKIDCNYCHTGVTKSKNANIPSPNICMNCHSSINKGANTGTEEIEKIYAAVENNEPIEWVRVHNLPDLAYFNHSQHYEVGGVQCQTCHGPIEEMEVVRQYANLTMGWCVNCHKETTLNTKGNAYYDKLVEIHEGKGEFTVAENGGLDCAKCHY